MTSKNSINTSSLERYICMAVYLIAFLSSSMATAAFSGAGSGTADDPYEISTCTELQEMENNLSAHYELVNDIDCSA